MHRYIIVGSPSSQLFFAVVLLLRGFYASGYNPHSLTYPTSDFFLLHGDADSLVDCLVSAAILSTMGMVSTHSEHSNYKSVLFEQLLKSKYIRYALLKSGGHPWVPATLTEDVMPPAFPVCEGWN